MSEFAMVLVAFAVAFAIVGGIAFYKDPSVECVKAGGTWVVDTDRSSGDHCEKNHE